MTDDKELTDRQRQVLGVIQRFVDDRGYAPSYREIALAIGVRSTNAVSDHVSTLESKGYLKRADQPNVARSLQLVKRPKK